MCSYFREHVPKNPDQIYLSITKEKLEKNSSNHVLLTVLCIIFLSPVIILSFPGAYLLLSLAFIVCGGEFWHSGQNKILEFVKN